jgi:cell division protein FtsQ
MSAATSKVRRGMPPAAVGIPVPSDKRFRRSELRPARRRNWRRTLIRSGWIALAALVSIGFAVWIAGLVVDAPILRVNDLEFSGHVRMTPAAIEERLSGLRGESLLRVDLEKFRLQLAASPWVAQAELWRVLPSTVRVRIVERKPLAIARFDGQMYLVDAEGMVLDAMGPKYFDLDLPIIDGLAPAASVGTTVDAARIRLVERMLHDLSANSHVLERLSQADVSNPRNAIVTLRDEPAMLYLGDEQFLSRLEQWIQTAPSVRAQFEITQHVDLRYGTVMYGK